MIQVEALMRIIRGMLSSDHPGTTMYSYDEIWEEGIERQGDSVNTEIRIHSESRASRYLEDDGDDDGELRNHVCMKKTY